MIVSRPAPLRLAGLLTGLVLAFALAAPAGATSETLRRSVSNMVSAPLDLATAPIVAFTTVRRNLNEIEDSRGVRLFYPIPGFLWTTSVQMGTSVLRELAGVLELIPGLILLPLESDSKPLFDPAEDNEALVDWDTPPIRLKFGIDYTTAPF